ncbi:hypothetical protein Q9295_13240 [Xinfangfangia sp. CPCC 101601]|uniref:Uncharacterized protein n=2 Tax=Pseudogemmobacter lacusdianii TaxID=3069608 RepID=A0ABU0VZZ9_9RHOB|nr:hypothetical protein [Xinfangfangia sp. CPCC 101601]
MNDPDGEQIEVLNVTSPSHVGLVNRAKYMAMHQALMAALPDQEPGMTPAEAKAALLPHLDATLFPEGDKAGWWLKCVQLDLEARGEIARGPKAPVRLYRLPS